MVRERLSRTYREPFLGAGSLFFAVEPVRAVLSDVNGDLIEAWQQIRYCPNELLKELRRIPVDEKTFYWFRDLKPRCPFRRAVRFIYLNRCCYGGLYRTNRHGEFNVPYGGGSRTPAPLWERGQPLRASAVLASSKVKLKQQDFEAALKSAAHGDVCFLDPAYVALKRGPFDRYNAKLFKWADQVRLQKVAKRAAARGAVVIVTNVDCKEIRNLYADALLIPLKRPKAIGNATTTSSSAKHELLIIYDERHWHNAWVQAAVNQPRPKLASKILVPTTPGTPQRPERCGRPTISKPWA